MNKAVYESPLSSRYASDKMQYIFSADKKFSTWRRLWVALARAEMELGLPITQEQVGELVAHLTDIDYELAAIKERELRHDVMAHIHAYGAQCPKAMPIIHLGATSCYVGDNTDIIIMREGLTLLRDKLIRVINALARFSDKYKALPTLGFTHFQAAQLGTTGTQASFLELFKGDHEKCKELDRHIAQEMGFKETVPVSGQTYSRKVDAAVLATLSGIAQSACKFATDVRLLCHLKEVEEPFEAHQIGSSAMPYKRNPMRCERICSLARFVIADAANPAYTSATQWFERTLDDSANKRISVPEAFLAVDAILNIYENVASGLVVHEKVIEKHIMEELPFMASENIMMDMVQRGGDRQQIHERIRVHSQEAGRNVKDFGLTNNLIDLLAADPLFDLSREELSAHLEPSRYIGRCPEQVADFLGDCVRPVLEAHRSALSEQAEDLKV